MIRFVLRRAGRALVTVFVVLLVTFGLTRIAYRNPAAMLAPRDADAQGIAAVKAALRLDDPWYVQLWRYLVRGPEVQGTPTGLLHWPPSFGHSFRANQPVTELIWSKVGATASLAIGAVLLWVALSLLLGVISARRAGSWVDRSLSGLSYVGLSVPTFLTGIVLSYFLFFKLSTYGIRWFPNAGYVGLTDDPLQWARHLLLPWATIVIAQVGIFQRVVRAGMLDALGADHIRSARAKGISERRVHYDYALRSALNPIITLSGLELGSLLGGAIITEQIFGIDGVGRLAVGSALKGDFPVVIGTTALASVAFILSSFVVDVITYWRDPASSGELS